MVVVFGSPTEEYGYRQSLFFVLPLLPVLAGTTYLFLNFLVPRYLLKRRFFLFGLFSLYALIVAAWLEIMIVMGLFVMVYKLQMDLMNPKVTDLSYLVGTIFLIILPAIAIQATRQWYRERERSDQLKQEKLELELYARQKELDYLKEQMHPHFLFNVLNNLYGLTLEKSDKAPELVLRVSSMLDYMLYRSSDPTVPLQDELEHIWDYLEIQKIRCGGRLEVYFQSDVTNPSVRIAPMILLPFVENSFKHGVAKLSIDTYVNISVATYGETISFEVANAVAQQNGKETQTGVGLANVKKRLDLIYGSDYELEINKSEQEFRVALKLPAKHGTHEQVDLHDRG